MGIVRILPFVLLLLLPSVNFAQHSTVTLSGILREKTAHTPLAYANITLNTPVDTAFVMGTITNEAGRFSLGGVKPGTYILAGTYLGFIGFKQAILVGHLSPFLDLGTFEMMEEIQNLSTVSIEARQDELSARMDKKTFRLEDHYSQSGGSVLQSMRNLPGITVDQEGKVRLRGSDQVAILVDGNQTALTGFGAQTGLDHLPASAIEKIEIINNPSAKYDANGNAGIINIIFRKNKQDGFSGKAGISTGFGALGIKKENFPDIRPQYRFTPKINPSLSLNHRKKKTNIYLQADYLYSPTLNKNEFVERTYDLGEVIRQQTKRNRNTSFTTIKSGFDWIIDENNTFTLSALFGSEKIIDRGDEPFFNADLSERFRLWQFLEDELKTTVTSSAAYLHKFSQPGHQLNVNLNYTYHRENEKYFFTNILPAYTGEDAFKLISDEHVGDLSLDYVRPLRFGRLEGGLKFRRRVIPTNMQFFPGLNSPLDSNAGGWATYKETIPALYGNLVVESRAWEIEAGLRAEYVHLQYDVNPNHNTYASDGYRYLRMFPTLRLAYKLDNQNKLSLFYNRRVDRPNEIDIRIFPKYDDPEIIKIGNPALRPQFTQSIELGFKTSWQKGYGFASLFHRRATGTIVRIGSIVPGQTLIYSILQNTGLNRLTGMEWLLSQTLSEKFSFNLNMTGYENKMGAFRVVNLYPAENVFSAEKDRMLSGSFKLNATIHFSKALELQAAAAYLAPDLIPQGKVGSRFSLDAGLKKKVQQGKGEIYFNATDLLNTMLIRKEIKGIGFSYISTDYFETQVVRIGYDYTF